MYRKNKNKNKKEEGTESTAKISYWKNIHHNLVCDNELKKYRWFQSSRMHKSPFNVLSKAISSLLLLALSWRFRWKSLPFTGHRLLHFQYLLQIRFLGFTFNRKEENPSLITALFIFDLLRFGLVYSLFLHSCYCVYLLKVSDLGFMWVGRFLLNSNLPFSLFLNVFISKSHD